MGRGMGMGRGRGTDTGKIIAISIITDTGTGTGRGMDMDTGTKSYVAPVLTPKIDTSTLKLAPLKARWSQAQVRAHTQVQLDALQATPVEPPTPSTFTVEAVEAAEYFVDVPDEVYPGEEFRTVLEGREVVVKCPDITRIGQRIVVMVKPTVSIVI
ncbi:hypothetical protein B484DRAFT_399331 [Ochromonadaceae sp. CCMP2298]|nr:hypothetical protein B484DRAFT_399331 [Ochromonadaceae sp. CCMP2298]